MGPAIAACAASAGYHVVVYDDAAALATAVSRAGELATLPVFPCQDR